MNNRDARVLACVDRSPFAAVVGDYAAWAARRTGVPLEFLHVIDTHEAPAGRDHSGAIGLDAQEHLLHELVERDEAHSRAQRESGRVFLGELRQRALAAGVREVDVRQRNGVLAEALSELQSGVGLVVLGRRGASATRTGRDMGRNLEWAVRAVQRPVLAVTEEFREPSRVLLAYDGSAVTRRGVESIARGKLLQGLPIHVLMAGQSRRASSVDWATQTLVSAGLEVSSAIMAGDPERVIAQSVQAREIDLLVMGAYTHAPLRSLVFGSKTTDLLRASKIPALLLR
ncbi:universal stress protein [Ramlibacter sp. AW1]|uniref:Universal stress protein n=2 Tax=Ramlibacter aurantiacus TaxID=2801330 RepID=A0A936ZMG8_9BURK|nr:universal stress protein [Ramlibacter aurantiacus]